MCPDCFFPLILYSVWATKGKPVELKKDVFVKDLKNKDEINSIFCLKHLALMEGRDGRSYLNIILSDATGDIEARVWQEAHEINKNLKKGEFVTVSGKVNLFQGRRQFIIKTIQSTPSDSLDLKDFITSSSQSAERMLGELDELLDGLDDFYIRSLLKNIFNDADIRTRLRTWPAGKTIHHPYQAGLLEHMLSCAKLGQMLSPYYGVNQNYVIAGCLLHDICKVYELSDGPVVEYTDEGKLVGHLIMGTELIEEFCRGIAQFPTEVKLHLKHLIVSHHGEYSYGSPKLPQTSEAYLVHLIDLMDSKMNSLEVVKRADQQPGPWSAFVKHLDRLVYKDPLPTFSDPPEEEKKHIPELSPRKPSRDEPLKQNLGKLLKDLKS